MWEENKFFQNSDYFINPTNQQYVHFTSIENYINICATNELRLYDLNFVDDPNEILFAAKNLGISDYYDYNEVKLAINSMSFCTYPFHNEIIEHDLWRLYGQNGNGLGIIFSFQNDCLKWKNYHISKVYYNQTENINKLKETLAKHNIFISKLKERFEITTSKKFDFPIDLLIKLLAFHKNSIYQSENELRLIYLGKTLEDRIYTSNKRKKISNFIKLPLFNRVEYQNNGFNASRPVIKIEKIILGYRYSEIEKLELQTLFRNIIAHNYKHYSTNAPIVEITDLVKYFR